MVQTGRQVAGRERGGRRDGVRVGKGLRHLVGTFTVLLRIEAASKEILHTSVGSKSRLRYY